MVDNNLYIPNRPFFPSDWTQEKVISKIQEACIDFKKRNILPTLNHHENDQFVMETKN